jgi:hypothetical protein
MNEHLSEDVPDLSRDGKFISTYGTIIALMVMTGTVVLLWANLKYSINSRFTAMDVRFDNVDRRLDGVVYEDDLERALVQLQVINAKVPIVVPRIDDVVRRAYRRSTPPPAIDPPTFEPTGMR